MKTVLVSWMAVTSIWACTPAVQAEVVRCPDIKDVWVSSNPQENTVSMGRTEKLKLKVLQEMALMGFDLSALKGRRITSADLYLYPVAAKGDGLIEGRPTNLRWIVVSTVSSQWVEGSQQESYKPDLQGHGASYRQASTGRSDWAWPGSSLSDVINGHLNSVYSAGELVPADSGYWKVPVEVKVIEALVAGLGDGLSIMDGSTSAGMNSFLYSREAKGKAPYLLVQVEDAQAAAVEAPQIVDAAADAVNATLELGAVKMTVRTSPETLGLRVKVDGRMLEPWQVGFLKNPDGASALGLAFLPAGKEISLEVAAVSASGAMSDWVKKSSTVSDKVTVPDLANFPFTPEPGEPAKIGTDLVVWAFPEVVEVDPVTARPLFEKDKQGYRLGNPVWSGADGKIRIAAARGEIAAFQIGIEHLGKPASAQVTVEVRGPGGESLDAKNIRLYRLWYVPSGAGGASESATKPAAKVWNPEYVVPIQAGKVQVPMTDNKIPGQKLQAVYVDMAIPVNAQAGTYKGQVRLRSDTGEAVLPMELIVYPVTIPAQMNFNPEMNCYGGPGKAGTKEFFDYHRLAHYNRCTLNRVAHSQNGSVHDDMVPTLAGEGAKLRVADWAAYDKRIGPLLDGSAFAGLPREGVPVKSFYLPFFENWPVSMQGHYHMNMPPAKNGNTKGKKDTQWKELHDLTAKPVEEAFDEAYKEGFVNVVSQFCKHYDQKGWTKTLCEMYQNNKYGGRGTWWTLDEPNEWADWAALRFFAELFHRGTSTPHTASFLYRGDISRPQWQGAFMDGAMDIMYSGSAVGLTNPELLMHIKQRSGMLLYIYGACNPVEQNSFESAAWCLKSFVAGADGVLPWQSLGENSALEHPDTNGLLVTGNRFGTTAVASVRVLAMRHAAQQCELLKQIVDRRGGGNRWYGAALVAQKVALAAEQNLENVDLVTAGTFQEMSAAGFLELKEGLLQMLSETPKAKKVAKE